MNIPKCKMCNYQDLYIEKLFTSSTLYNIINTTRKEGHTDFKYFRSSEPISYFFLQVLLFYPYLLLPSSFGNVKNTL